MADNSKDAANLASVVPDTGFDLGYRFGRTDRTSSFTLSNVANSPEVFIRSRAFYGMGRLDLSGADPAALEGDQIGKGIIDFWMPVFKRYMQAALRNNNSTAVPTLKEVATYYALVSEYYEMLCTPILINAVYEDVDWSKIRRNISSLPPPCIEELANDWNCRPLEFDSTWLPRLHFLAHQAMLPNIAPIIDRMASAYLLDEYDQTLRMDLPGFWYYGDTGSTASFITRLNDIQTLLGATDMENTRYYLLNFLPYRAGIPMPAMLGVSPGHVTSWRNQSFYSQDAITFVGTNPGYTTQCVCSNASGTDPSTQAGLSPNVGDPVLVDCFADDISVAEYMFTTVFKAVSYSSPNWTVQLMSFILDEGTYLIKDNGTQLLILQEGTHLEGTTLAIQNPEQLLQYAECLGARFFFSFSNAGGTIVWNGSRDRRMSPTQFFDTEADELMYLLGPATMGIKWLNYLSAVVAGSFPRSVHYSIERAFSLGSG